MVVMAENKLLGGRKLDRADGDPEIEKERWLCGDHIAQPLPEQVFSSHVTHQLCCCLRVLLKEIHDESMQVSIWNSCPPGLMQFLNCLATAPWADLRHLWRHAADASFFDPVPSEMNASRAAAASTSQRSRRAACVPPSAQAREPSMMFW